MAKKKKKGGRRVGGKRVRSRAATHKTGSGGKNYVTLPEGVSFFSPEKDDNEIDLIPYEITVDTHPEVDKGDLWYERTIFVHYNVGPEETAILCPKTMGERCPICEEIKRMWKENEPDEDAIKAIKQKERQLFNLINVGAGNEDIQVWEISYHLFGNVLDEEVTDADEDSSVLDFSELEGGSTLTVKMREKTLGTAKFLETKRIDFDEREDYDEDILEKAVDLDACLNLMTYDQIQSIFLGLPMDSSGSGDEEEEDGKKDKGKKDKKPKGRRNRPEPEEKEEKEEPKKKPKKKKGKDGDAAEDCPGGGTYGKDTNDFEECEDCPVWDDCYELKKADKKKKKKKK